jgi:hypothetical protein
MTPEQQAAHDRCAAVVDCYDVQARRTTKLITRGTGDKQRIRHSLTRSLDMLYAALQDSLDLVRQLDPATVDATTSTEPEAVPIDWSTTDPAAWAAAYLKAVNHDPEIVGTVDGTASWFATAIEVGRRDKGTDDDPPAASYRR